MQGMTAERQADDGRRADGDGGLAENMDALKHNFLLRGFFKDRGYFDLARDFAGGLPAGCPHQGQRSPVARVWLRADALFEPAPASPQTSD